MIKSVIIQNFQSHKKTSLTFSSGINSIVGISDSGKTAILRAIYWAIYNRPLGDDDVSFWNRDKNNSPIKSTYIKIENSSGIIERRKGKVKKVDSTEKFNGYIINESDYFDAIGTNVPDEVSKLFNLDEVNFQGQFDPSFLLSNSAGEVARFFNSTIRLDLIDRILSKADGKRLEINKEKKRLEIERNEIEKELANFDWLDDAEKLVDEIIKLDESINGNNKMRDDLILSLTKWRALEEEINSSNNILSAIPIIKKIETIQESLDVKITRYERLQNLYADWIEQNNIIGMADFSKELKLIEKIDSFNKIMEEKENELGKIKSNYEDWKIAFTDKEFQIEKIIELEKQLPKNCPTCGAKLENDKCHD